MKKKSDMDLLKKRMQDVRDASEESLIQLKREIEAKQAELQAKQQELMVQERTPGIFPD